MHIAVVALSSCCDYRHFGGAESVVRRLAAGLCDLGHYVDYLLYSNDAQRTLTIDQHMRVRYLSSFTDVLKRLSSGYDQVITVHISPKDRLPFAWFQTKHRHRMKFHKLMLGTPASVFRWIAFVGDAIMNTRGGRIITISNNTARMLSKLQIKHSLLLPPVPDSYYSVKTLRPEDSLTVTYMGRLDSEKGADTALDILDEVLILGRINTMASFYSWNSSRTVLSLETRHNGKVTIKETCSGSMYNHDTEHGVIDLLTNTDILILLYQTMLGTIDPPMLVLEAMAAGCVCITTPVGNIEHVYGKSAFVIRGNFKSTAVQLIRSLLENRKILLDERERVRKRVCELDFSASCFSKRLENILFAKT